MYNNHSNGASYGFKAPNIAEDAGRQIEVMFPTFEKLTPTLSSNAASVVVKRTHTLVDLGSTALAAAATLTAAADDNLPAGSRLMVKWTNGGTKYDVTLKLNATTTCATLTGIASTTVCYELVWTGTAWQLIQ
jgi:hypothetical protein